jgi:hypothetical protein
LPFIILSFICQDVPSFPSPDRSSPLFFDDASIDAHPRLGSGVASRLARHSALGAHGFGSSGLSRGSGFDATAPPRSTSGFDAASAHSGSGFDAAAPPCSTSGFDAGPLALVLASMPPPLLAPLLAFTPPLLALVLASTPPLLALLLLVGLIVASIVVALQHSTINTLIVLVTLQISMIGVPPDSVFPGSTPLDYLLIPFLLALLSLTTDYMTHIVARQLSTTNTLIVLVVTLRISMPAGVLKDSTSPGSTPLG